MIYFVGAGSGAADLITLRGMRLLEQADVLVWAGSLVNKTLLSYCKPSCQMYDSARLTLEETDEILQRAEKEGKLCLRLHTGDPAIYGAIREQMERLDAAGIGYEVVPGVSSMFAAAASLKKEFTVPGVSQTVIVSRMEGRTPVPEREKIRSLASHGATMVLFLSSGMIPALVDELLAGGAYTEETPCAVVYKASWPEEKIVRGTLSDIAQKASEAGIRKTALVLVGDFLGDYYQLSRLYDKHFSTEYRQGEAEKDVDDRQNLLEPACICEKKLDFDRITLVCFSEKGAELAEKLRRHIEAALTGQAASLKLFHCFGENHPPLRGICSDSFAQAQGGERVLFVFVGAAGIAVRSLAPFVQSKETDPAVVSLDEGGRFAIPLLSGHLGGANDAAQVIADFLGAIPVVTTATDVRGLWAIDTWAKAHGWQIPDLLQAKKISAAVLAGKKIFSVGIGCRRGSDSRRLSEFVRSVFAEKGLDISLVKTIASIDLKKDEGALLNFAAELAVPFVTFSAEELNAADAGLRGFTSSDFVKEKTGTDAVCERSSVCAAHTSADWLLVRKTSRDGMTVALSVSA